MLWLWILFAVWSVFQFLVTGSIGWALVFAGDLFMIAYKWRNRAPRSGRAPHDSGSDGQNALVTRRDRSSWLLVAFFAVGAVVVVPPLVGMVRQLGGSGIPWLAAVPLVLLGLTAFNGVLYYRNRTASNLSAEERRAQRSQLVQEGQTYSKKGLLIALALTFILGLALLAWIGAHQDEIAADLSEQQYR